MKSHTMHTTVRLNGHSQHLTDLLSPMLWLLTLACTTLHGKWAVAASAI